MKISSCLKLICIVYLILFSAHLRGQVTIIKAGKIADPLTGKVLTNQRILIENNRIKEIGPDIAIPSEAKVINLSKHTLSPGLFDVHTHLCSNLSKFADWLGVDYFDMVLLNPEGYRAIQGTVYAKQMLDAGFTTVRDAGNAGKYADVDVKRAINEGLVPGPNMFVAGRIIAPFGGQFRTKADKQFLNNSEYYFADTHDELRKAIRENIYYGADFIKIVVDGQKYQYNLEDLKLIVKEAGNAGVKVMAHCQTPAGEYAAASAGVASIEHGWTTADSVAALMKKKNIYLVSTDFTVKVLISFGMTEDKAKLSHARRVERLKRAYRAGVPIAFGTDIMVDVENETRGTLAVGYIDSFVEAEIPAKDILKIMTVNAAKLLGIDKERGLIAPGMYADIIATPENPLENIHTLKQVSFVMKNGKVYKE